MAYVETFGDRLRSSAVFLARFLRHPRAVGAVAPSSRFLARRMADRVAWRPGITVVEFGPGTGSFTAELLTRLPPQGRYLGIELDPVFAGMLRARFPEAEFEAASVERLEEIAARRRLDPIDHIVSGLPFASLPVALIQSIVAGMARALRSGGGFTTFQYLHAYPLPSAGFFRRLMAETFGPCRRVSMEARNLPPALVLRWEKRG